MSITSPSKKSRFILVRSASYLFNQVNSDVIPKYLGGSKDYSDKRIEVLNTSRATLSAVDSLIQGKWISVK